MLQNDHGLHHRMQTFLAFRVLDLSLLGKNLLKKIAALRRHDLSDIWVQNQNQNRNYKVFQMPIWIHVLFRVSRDYEVLNLNNLMRKL